MKKVLLITYYWPPAGGGGVQRWLKFVKYLPEFGWTPIVYTPENPDYPLLDETLMKDVNPKTEIIRHKIFEPYRWYRNLSGKKDAGLSAGFIRDKKKMSLASFLIAWIRGNMILPDARRFWIKPSVKYLSEYLAKNPVDVVITTGPPQSMHLIGLRLRKKFGIKWIVDFRDPWLNMDNADKLQMGQRAIGEHARWEKEVVQAADSVISASYHVARQYEKLRGNKVHAITNGFDPEDFTGISKQLHGKFMIGHFGTLGSDRNPEQLWKVLNDRCRSDISFSDKILIYLAGPTDASILESIEANGLKNKLVFIPYLSHRESIQQMMNCDVLLLPLNRNASEEGRIPGKIFEYIATRNFVLGFGSTTGDSATILNESGAGVMVKYEDEAEIGNKIFGIFSKEKLSGVSNVEAYTGKN